MVGQATEGLTHGQVASAAGIWLHKAYLRPALVECGLPNQRRADVLAMDLRTKKVWIVEAKASRSDFLRGQKNFDIYRRWCDLFYVAAPEGLITPDELPKGVGLLVVKGRADGNGNTWYRASMVRRAATYKPDAKLRLPDWRERIETRVMSWLLAFYEAHHLNCRNPKAIVSEARAQVILELRD